MKVFIKVTDLIAIMTSQQRINDTEDAHALLAPDIDSLLSSPIYASQAFRNLKMDCGASYYKVDPEFFRKYPELYDPSDEIIASGVPLKLGTQNTLTSSNPLNAAIVSTYRSFIDFSFDAVQALSVDPSELNLKTG